MANERGNLLDRRKFHMMKSGSPRGMVGGKMRRPGKASWNPEEVARPTSLSRPSHFPTIPRGDPLFIMWNFSSNASLLRQSCKDGSTRSQDQTIEKAWVGFPFSSLTSDFVGLGTDSSVRSRHIWFLKAHIFCYTFLV